MEVPQKEYWDLAVNGITLQAGKVIMNKGSPRTTKELEKRGVDVIQVDFWRARNSLLQVFTAPPSS